MTNGLTKSVAAEVRAELARRNIGRTETAERLGISRTALWSRLRGETPFGLAELAALAEWWGVPLAQFLPGPTSSDEQVAA